MNNIDEWLNSKPVAKVVNVQPMEPGVLMTVKKPFPYMTVILSGALAFCVYSLYIKDNSSPSPEPVPVVVNVEQFVERAGRDYNLFLSKSFDELAKQVDSKVINNGKELLPTAKALTGEAREKSIGRINQLDQDNMPLADEKLGAWTDENRAKVVKYLKEKSQGHLKASK